MKKATTLNIRNKFCRHYNQWEREYKVALLEEVKSQWPQ